MGSKKKIRKLKSKLKYDFNYALTFWACKIRHSCWGSKINPLIFLRVIFSWEGIFPLDGFIGRFFLLLPILSMTPLQPPRTPPGMKTADFANEQAYQAYLNALFHLINVVIRIRGRHFKNLMRSKFQSDHTRIFWGEEFLVPFFSRSRSLALKSPTF